MESIVQPNDEFLSAPKLDYDGFISALRENFGCFSPARGTNIFAGKVRTRRVFGFAAVDLTCNASGMERTELDTTTSQVSLRADRQSFTTTES
jgi:AraC family transcriptional regulator, positive regulator of tynA and feaB